MAASTVRFRSGGFDREPISAPSGRPEPLESCRQDFRASCRHRSGRIPSPYSTKQCRQICKSFRIRGVRKCRPRGAQAQSATHARDFHGRTIRSGTVSRLPKKCRRGVVSGLCRDFQLVSAFAHRFNRIDPTAAEMAGSGVFHFVEASKVDSGPIPAPVPALTTTHKRRNAI